MNAVSRFPSLVSEWKKEHMKDDTVAVKYAKMIDSYQVRSRPWVRGAVLTILVVGVVVGILALQGKLTTFPQSTAAWFKNLNWVTVVAVSVNVTVLTAGGIIVIARTLKHTDPIVKNPGKFSGDAHWQPAIIHHSDASYVVHIDKSTLNKWGSGKAYVYGHKTVVEHYAVASEVGFFAIPRMVGAIVWNVLRFCVIPFYILTCMAIEKCKGEAIHKNDRPFALSDIPKEMWRSVKKIVLAPFYGIAHLFAMIYSMVSPLNGRRLGAVVERMWNDDTTRAEAWWSVGGPQKRWIRPWKSAWWSPSQMGKNNFRVAGCHDAFYVATYDKWKMMNCHSLTAATDQLRAKSLVHEPSLLTTSEMFV